MQDRKITRASSLSFSSSHSHLPHGSLMGPNRRTQRLESRGDQPRQHLCPNPRRNRHPRRASLPLPSYPLSYLSQADKHVAQNAICPGLIETGMTTFTFDRARERGTLGKVGQLNPLRRCVSPHRIEEVS